MPALLPIILAGIQAAISAAPQVAEVIAAAKNLLTSLFGAGVISKEQQDALHQWVDSHAALVQQGIEPPSWSVEPD
jgi:hypothetical protein